MGVTSNLTGTISPSRFNSTRSSCSSVSTVGWFGVAGRRRSQPDLHRAAAEAGALQVAGQRELVAGIDPFGSFQVHHPHVQRPFVAAQAHGVERDLGRAGQRRGLAGVQARIAAAVAEHDDAGHRVRRVPSGPRTAGPRPTGSPGRGPPVGRPSRSAPACARRPVPRIRRRAWRSVSADVRAFLQPDHGQELDLRIAQAGHGQDHQRDDHRHDAAPTATRAWLRRRRPDGRRSGTPGRRTRPGTGTRRRPAPAVRASATDAWKASSAETVGAAASGGASLRQGSDLGRLRLLIEAVHDHVVLLAQLDQQRALRQFLHHALDAARRRLPVRRPRRPAGPCSGWCRPAASTREFLTILRSVRFSRLKK